VHLNSPATEDSSGWNVIGGTEPALPGVAIGHNDRIAWGMTIVGTDQTDIFVEQTDAADRNRYRSGSEWLSMRVERVGIRVRGELEPRIAELKFTRNGPVIFEDPSRNRAYALRWAGSEPGTAGYLGALALDRAGSWREFLDAAVRWKLPSENLVYADVDGHIGWIAAALTPVRSGWDGLLPVPGASGRFRWAGFVPTSELPKQFDPADGFIATANHNILPSGYGRMVSYEWSAPFRFQRIDEVLRQQFGKLGRKHSIEDSKVLQHDATSVAARRIVTLLRRVDLTGELVKPLSAAQQDETTLLACIEMLRTWDGSLSRDSAAAALFTVWQQRLNETVLKPRMSEKLWARYAGRSPLAVTLQYLERAATEPGPPDLNWEKSMVESLASAIQELSKRQGADRLAWRLDKLHEASFRHMLGFSTTVARADSTAKAPAKSSDPNRSEVPANRAAIAAAFDLPSVGREGDAFAPIATGGPNFQQTTGASFRHVIDLDEWDRSVATSVPGQSGQPASPHYGDLLPLWADGKYFPLLFSRAAVDAAVSQRLLLVPQSH
jgi:penicillin amidase